MQLDLRVHRLPAQAGQVAMLGFAKQVVLRAGQDQRVTLGQIGP